jgi:WD40 repeat protein
VCDVCCVTLLCFRHAGGLLATASLDSTVRVWRVSDGSCVQTLEGPGDGVEWVTWHPKGDVVLAGSEDFTLWMWLAQSGNCMQVRWMGVVYGGWLELPGCTGGLSLVVVGHCLL